METNRTVSVDGLNFAVFDHGAGSPVLFVHGFPVNHAMWSTQQSVCNGFRMIAPDLRGFGGSDATPGATTMEQFASDLHGCLDALGVNEPIIYVGLSMGGYIAWPFMAQRPKRVRALVLANTRVVADTPDGAKTRRETAKRVSREGVGVVEPMLDKLFGATTKANNPTLIEQGRAMIREAKPLGVAGALLGMADRPDVSDRLSKLQAPTLVIAGAEDAVFPPSEMEGFARAIPKAEFVLVERAGHMSPMENPAAFNEAMHRLLDRVTNSRS